MKFIKLVTVVLASCLGCSMAHAQTQCERAAGGRELVLSYNKAKGLVELYLTDHRDAEGSLEHAQKIAEASMDEKALQEMLTSPELLNIFLKQQVTAQDEIPSVEPTATNALLGSVHSFAPSIVTWTAPRPRPSDLHLTKPKAAYAKPSAGPRYFYYRPYR